MINKFEITYSQSINQALDQMMHTDKNLIVFGLDVEDHNGIQGTTLGLKKYGKNRFFSTPLSEDSMTGVAIGAAAAGLKVVHVHIRMDFVLLAMNQIVNMAAKMRYMYNGQVKVPLVIRCMVGRSWGQGPQHSQSLASIFAHIPGLKVCAPSNPYDAKGLLISAIKENCPVIFMEHRLLYETKSFVPNKIYNIPIGLSRFLTKGKDITLVSNSHMSSICYKVAKILKKFNIEVELIDLRTIKPLDIKTILKSVKKTNKLLVVDNAWSFCGLSSEIISQVFLKNQSKSFIADKITFLDVPCPTTPSLEKEFYPSPKKIIHKIINMLSITKKIYLSEKDLNIKEIDNFRGPF